MKASERKPPKPLVPEEIRSRTSLKILIRTLLYAFLPELILLSGIALIVQEFLQ
ncbi:hypothetical protein [Entomobacter blattae]|uniref:Uncharacterized protein n=1 Tax=Entomobacter blattae TaxID=2762277 RepID=A0A7H1NRQ5_9PROT|nr:hypothetical protein [Entomobacter blattae]QNT78465.1 hypothetical protein JGUZn3_12390 [Entomobacter blattae]